MNLTTRQWNFLALAALLAGMVWVGIGAGLPGTLAAPSLPAPQAGFLAPDFTLQTASGEAISLSELRGKAVLLNVWASWCGPCRAEMPAMQRIYEEYAGQGLVVLAVNATDQDSAAAALAFASELGLTFPIVFDTDGGVGRQYAVRALPSSYFIRPDGVIEEVIIGGPMAEALLRIRVENLLGGQP